MHESLLAYNNNKRSAGHNTLISFLRISTYLNLRKMSDNMDLVKFNAELTKGDQLKEDQILMNKSRLDIEGNLITAPLCLSLMGQLCLIATRRYK